MGNSSDSRGGKASLKGGCGFLPLRLGRLGRNGLHPSEAERQPTSQPSLAFLVAVQHACAGCHRATSAALALFLTQGKDRLAASIDPQG